MDTQTLIGLGSGAVAIYVIKEMSSLVIGVLRAAKGNGKPGAVCALAKEHGAMLNTLGTGQQLICQAHERMTEIQLGIATTCQDVKTKQDVILEKLRDARTT